VHLARYLGTSTRKVEEVCQQLGIERWSLGIMGREGESAPFSLDQAALVIQAVRARQGLRFIRQHRIGKL